MEGGNPPCLQNGLGKFGMFFLLSKLTAVAWFCAGDMEAMDKFWKQWSVFVVFVNKREKDSPLRSQILELCKIICIIMFWCWWIYLYMYFGLNYGILIGCTKGINLWLYFSWLFCRQFLFVCFSFDLSCVSYLTYCVYLLFLCVKKRQLCIVCCCIS